MRVVLVATYEMGRQPLGLATPAAWLRRAAAARGLACEVVCVDTSRQPLPAALLADADAVAVHLPMHTATRLALGLLPAMRAAAPGARFAAFGVYAALCRHLLLETAAPAFDAVFGGEFEAALTDYILDGTLPPPPAAPGSDLPRLPARLPDRSGLPPLARYARLRLADGRSRVAGYVEATRGCKHLCRHCPIVPVYGGRFRAAPVAAVLADIRQQVAGGAEHITFGDPDFFNGPTHARRVVEALHREFPGLSYDVTIKVEHLLRHADLLPVLRETGCVLVTTAVESFDDAVLAKLDKGHTRADFLAALARTRAEGLALNPTFVAFTPWTTPAAFAAMCETLAELDLVEPVQPVQLGIRLLIPPGSRLLELPDAAAWLGPWDPATLSYRWRAPEPHGAPLDALCARVQDVVAEGSRARRSRAEIFENVAAAAGLGSSAFRAPSPAPPRAAIPWLDEPWFC